MEKEDVDSEEKRKDKIRKYTQLMFDCMYLNNMDKVCAQCAAMTCLAMMWQMDGVDDEGVENGLKHIRRTYKVLKKQMGLGE